MAHSERRGLMDGIVSGLEHKKHRPVVDGIVTGVPRKAHLRAAPEMHRVVPSATQSSEGVFGAGRTPEGDGNGKGGMKLAHKAESNGTKKGMPRKTARKAYEGLEKSDEAARHAAVHNY
jgi:hypothetical protein